MKMQDKGKPTEKEIVFNVHFWNKKKTSIRMYMVCVSYTERWLYLDSILLISEIIIEIKKNNLL